MVTDWSLLPQVRLYALPHYHAAGRAYHNDMHVRHLLMELSKREVLTPTLALAVWGHDLIYNPRRHDNEERSAKVFDGWLQAQGVDAEVRGQVKALILATRHTAPPATREEALLLDADLSILGAEEADFQVYEAGIREEYAHVPAPLYHLSRRKILQRFLKRERIYFTPEFAALEEQARANLQASLHHHFPFIH